MQQNCLRSGLLVQLVERSNVKQETLGLTPGSALSFSAKVALKINSNLQISLGNGIKYIHHTFMLLTYNLFFFILVYPTLL